MGMSGRLLRPSGRFTPKSISGLAIWLDASDSSTLGNTSSAAGGASNNGPVKYWGDKSGNSRNAINSGADSVCPTLISSGLNGLSVLGFDGGDFIGGALSLTLVAETIFAVVRMASGTANNGRLFTQSDANLDYSTTGHYIPLLRQTTTDGICSFASGSARAGVSVSTNSWLLVISQHSGSLISNRLNNGTASTFSHTLNKTFTSYRIGASLPTADASTWQDRVAEVVVYSRDVTAAERSAVAKYLGRKWGITVA